jgi:hypothetical protein
LLLLAGCSSPLNQGRLIGGEVALDSVTPEVERGEREWQAISVVSLDRSNWAQMRFAVPLDAVEHQPTYTQQPYLLCETARQRGEYPSVATALDTSTTNTLDEQALEMVVAPLSGLFDIVMFAPRAIAGAVGGDEWGGHPWEVVASPLAPYERAPGGVVAAPEAEEAVGAEESPEAVPSGWPWEEPTAEPQRPEPPRRPKMEVGG